MEATGHHWLPLYAHLRQDGQTVHVIKSLQSDALRNMNDTIDALIVALRELCRQRFFVVDMASDLRLLRALALPLLLFSEIGGDIRKFSSVAKLVAYAGLYPKSRQSGDSKTDGRMSKRGSPYLRRAVWLAAALLSAFFTKRNALKEKTI
ncbi:MAG: transposase [Selenomonadaceae bacterium]|nr:transposase [Selenomonadaceae bacterium]